MDPFETWWLHRERGIVLEWFHANAPSTFDLDPLRNEPALTIGGPRVESGSFGEQYPVAPAMILGIFGRPRYRMGTAMWGLTDAAEAQITVPVPFRPDSGLNIPDLPSDLLALYNAGQFIAFDAQRDDGGETPTVAVDRFKIALGGVSQYWTPRNAAEPIVDSNAIVAWRIPLARFSI